MDTFLLPLLAIILVAAAICDLRYQKIPNILTYPTMIVALAFYTVTMGLQGLMFSAGGLTLGIGFFLIPYLMGGMGAGDAKLMGAVGSVLGARGVFNAALLTAFFGGIYAVYLIIAHSEDCKQLIHRCMLMLKSYTCTGKFVHIAAPKNEDKPKLCYGVAIFLGTVCTMGWKLSQNSFLI